MKKIASFCVDHTKLLPGVYVSRIDQDVTTYDIRLTRPNVEQPLSTGVCHTLEHLIATFVRNSDLAERVLYFGPMGCRTGFYLLLRSTGLNEALQLIRDGFDFAADYTGEIPGATEKECGNYRDQDPEGARRIARQFTGVLRTWQERDCQYDK